MTAENESGRHVAPFCAAVDWGTSSFRVWLLDGGGKVLSTRRSAEGMLAAAKMGFEPVLETHLRALGAPGDLPVIVCGMAGARQGWIEVPYLSAPTALDAVISGAAKVEGIGRDVRILPGIAQRAADRPDVMRGEETQLLGLLCHEPDKALVCLPGTHSKWAEMEDGSVRAFSTFMTGELFALLSEQSILRYAVAENTPDLAKNPAFAEAVANSLAEPASILTRLFALRAGHLLADTSPEANRAALSGMIVGLEIAGARHLYQQRQSIVLVASGPSRDLYQVALETADLTVRTVDAEEVVREGLFYAASKLFEETYRS